MLRTYSPPMGSSSWIQSCSMLRTDRPPLGPSSWLQSCSMLRPDRHPFGPSIWIQSCSMLRPEGAFKFVLDWTRTGPDWLLLDSYWTGLESTCVFAKQTVHCTVHKLLDSFRWRVSLSIALTIYLLSSFHPTILHHHCHQFLHPMHPLPPNAPPPAQLLYSVSWDMCGLIALSNLS